MSGPQEGGTPGMMEDTVTGWARSANLMGGDLHSGVLDLAGCGAAGGLGAALYACCGSPLLLGAEILTDSLALDAFFADDHLVLSRRARLYLPRLHGSSSVGRANPHHARPRRHIGSW
ncbi:glycerate kinase, partial [Salmonella enterica]|uniref:glycerate kinase n=1 Tax=Salmonella enterica TaxID=28901 RepID=UPI00398C6F53